MLDKIKMTSNYVYNIINEIPDVAIILGSGLGISNNIEDEISDKIIISYNDIPNFPKTTIKGHAGKLIYGKIYNKKILIMSGRFHYYEGHPIEKVVFPIRIFKSIGINKLIISNASGGVNKKYRVGDIMFIKDHINLIPEHPLRGDNIDELGPRFLDMHEAYDKEMIKIAEQVAQKHNIIYHKGVYVALQGPTFETPSEYGFIIKIGGDAVGMSTVPEVIVAKHMNMKVFALSVITDLGGPDMYNSVSHDEVLNVSSISSPSVTLIIKGLIYYL